MRGAHLMTDSKGSPEPVRVVLKLQETGWANGHRKSIEVDPTEWAEMDPNEREQYLNDRLFEYANECLDGDFEIVSDHDLNDPVEGE